MLGPVAADFLRGFFDLRDGVAAALGFFFAISRVVSFLGAVDWDRSLDELGKESTTNRGWGRGFRKTS